MIRIVTMFVLLLVGAGNAAAAEYWGPRELTFPEDGFAVMAVTDPDVSTDKIGAHDVTSYQFARRNPGGDMFIVFVTKLPASDTRTPEQMIQIPEGAQQITKITQSGVSGVQFTRFDGSHQTLARQFVKGRTIYSLAAMSPVGLKEKEADAAEKACWDWLNSWRLLDAEKP